MRSIANAKVALALLVAGAVVAVGAARTAAGTEPSSDASSIFAAPPASPTLVSELGTAVVQAPQAPAPPRAGVGGDANGGARWGFAAGAALALAGCGLVYASIRIRGARVP